MFMRPIPAETQRLIQSVIRDRLGQAGVGEARIRADEDHDGDPIIVIDVNHPYSDEPYDPRIGFGLTGEVQAALLAEGEERFPHVRHHFDDAQQIADIRKSIRDRRA